MGRSIHRTNKQCIVVEAVSRFNLVKKLGDLSGVYQFMIEVKN